MVSSLRTRTGTVDGYLWTAGMNNAENAVEVALPRDPMKDVGSRLTGPSKTPGRIKTQEAVAVRLMCDNVLELRTGHEELKNTNIFPGIGVSGSLEVRLGRALEYLVRGTFKGTEKQWRRVTQWREFYNVEERQNARDGCFESWDEEYTHKIRLCALQNIEFLPR